MKNLFEAWDKLAEGWKGKQLVLFLDYDGTLTPIVQRPTEAFLPEENRRLLDQLVKIPGLQVVVLSGRSLPDIKERVGIEGIVYIGNHGWEIEGSSMRFESLIPVSISSMMEKIKYELMMQLSEIQGAFVEDKGVTLSVHYRLVSKEKQFLVKRIFDHISMPYRRKNEIRAQAGKKVLELKPPVEWDKGKAALWLLRKQEILKGQGRVMPIYIGDDNTDEDAFGALHDKGVTVFVGTSRLLSAQYYLEGPQGVTAFLERIVEWFDPALAKARLL